MKISMWEVQGYVNGTLYYYGQQYPNGTAFKRTVIGPVGGIQFTWQYSPDGTAYGMGILSSGSPPITISGGFATLPGFEGFWVTEAAITSARLVGVTCSDDSCRIDCASDPDGFCCIDHSLTDRLLQQLRNASSVV